MGRYDGQGREFYDNGNIKYIGEFRYGNATGNGTYYDTNGNEIIPEQSAAEKVSGQPSAR